MVNRLEPVLMRIGPVTLSFTLSSRRLHASILKRYAGYLIASGRAAVAFTCTTRPVRIAGGEEVTLDMRDGVWHAVRRDFECTWSDRQGKMILHPSVYAFDACIRVLLATILPMHGALLVHGSSVVHRGRAWVFTGPSGFGKTTAARLCAPRRILNDEISVIGIRPLDRVYVNATPFWGEMGTGPATRRSYPLEAIHFLVKDSVTRRCSIDANSAITRFLRCICLFGTNAAVTQRALDIAARILRIRRAFELHFKKEPLDLNKV